MRQVQPRNTDRITKPVLVRAAIGAAVSILAVWGIDLNINQDQQGALADALLVAVPIVATLAGSLWGAFRARESVTPIGPNDIPRDGDGAELVRADGKPLYRHAVAREELKERLEDRPPDAPPKPRTDRRGVDRDPDRPR